ncbi:hypothetical protein B0H12DRAFT_1151682 [Mycena haematopus]|nr:hypothetical protein B0H12DRAFT_1151682 [Mycena haematopus]
MHYFLDIILGLAIFGGTALCRPIQLADETMMHFWSPPNTGTTQCFAQQAAVASDCASLLTNSVTTANWMNVAPPRRTAGCVFTDTPDMPIEDLVSAGDTLMGCIQPVNGLLNGVTKIGSTSSSVCMADSTGANSCFHQVPQ